MTAEMKLNLISRSIRPFPLLISKRINYCNIGKIIITGIGFEQARFILLGKELSLMKSKVSITIKVGHVIDSV